MGNKYGPVYEDDAEDLGRGIPEQTDEEAANEAAMNSSAARARRSVSDAENQIRANAVAKLASKAAPVMEMDNAPEIGTEGKRTSMEVGPAAKRTPIVTKEQLAASGLSLRDYLNKQQGLTRRDGAAPVAKNTPSTTSSAEVNGKRNYRLTPDDPVGTSMKRSLDKQLSDKDKVDLASPITAMRSLSRKFNTDESLPINERIRNAFGMKKGGMAKKMASGGSVSSASKRADGIAQRGKTKGKMC